MKVFLFFFVQNLSFVNLDKISMKAYIGVLLLAGVYKSNGEALKNFWNDEKGRPIFRATFSLKRFFIYISSY